MEIKIITEKGFTRIEMPSDISERELLLAKNILDRTLQEWAEKQHKPKLSFCKKCARFMRRLYHKIKKPVIRLLIINGAAFVALCERNFQ